MIVISSVGNPVRDVSDEGVASPDQNFLYLVTVRGGGVGDFSGAVGEDCCACEGAYKMDDQQDEHPALRSMWMNITLLVRKVNHRKQVHNPPP